MLRGWSKTRIAIAIAVASCGGAFTTVPDDGGDRTMVVDGAIDAPIPDGATEDVRVRREGGPRDALAEDGTTVDSSPGPADGSPIGHDGGPIEDARPEVGSDASACARTCPSDFDCIATKCVDRAAPHFSTTIPPPGNWRYGYAAALGGTFNDDTDEWKAGAAIEVLTHTMTSTLEPSVFHNSGSTAETYGGMTLGAGLLGLFPGATSEESVLRWIAPSPGSYTIDATFTGISTPATKVLAAVFIKSVAMGKWAQALNANTDTTGVFTFPTTTQSLLTGDAVDFCVTPLSGGETEPGGTELKATITAY